MAMENKEFEKIMQKARMKIAVSNFESEDRMLPKRKISKMVASFVLCAGLTSGLVFATTGGAQKVIEKIWKEPETYDYTFEITEEDKKRAISEDEAKQKASDYLKKIGLENEVSSIGLSKRWVENEIVWNLSFESGTITLDRDGNFKSLNIPTFNYKIPNDYGITREQARITARELLAKYNPNDNDDEYELVALRNNMENDEESYIWYATFYRKYDDLLNQYEKIEIGWIPTINGLYSLHFENNEYEKNEQIISKEKAIEIVKEKDKQIETRHSISSVEAEIGIDKMNTEVVYREKDIENYEKGTFNFEVGEDGKTPVIKEDAEFYKVEDRVRKVWEVTIIYDYYKYKENGNERFVYFVDSTTGEIIGGKRWAGSQEQIRKLMEDPYNFIEK